MELYEEYACIVLTCICYLLKFVCAEGQKEKEAPSPDLETVIVGRKKVKKIRAVKDHLKSQL